MSIQNKLNWKSANIFRICRSTVAILYNLSVCRCLVAMACLTWLLTNLYLLTYFIFCVILQRTQLVKMWTTLIATIMSEIKFWNTVTVDLFLLCYLTSLERWGWKLGLPISNHFDLPMYIEVYSSVHCGFFFLWLLWLFITTPFYKIFILLFLKYTL